MSTETRLSGDKLWQGQVRIDKSFDNYVSKITELSDAKQYTIEDIKYHHLIYPYLDGIGQLGFPTVITVLVEGKALQERMECLAANWYKLIEKTRGFIRKEKYYEKNVRAKGFKLVKTNSTQVDLPCLASYRGYIGKDNSFNIRQSGLVCFLVIHKVQIM